MSEHTPEIGHSQPEPVCAKAYCGERAYCSEAGECLAEVELSTPPGEETSS